MNYDLQSSNFRASNVPNSTSAESGLKRFGDKRISDLLVESRQANVHRQRVQEFIIEKLLFLRWDGSHSIYCTDFYLLV